MRSLYFPLITLLISVNALADSPVWKVESDKNTIYLGGTVHLLRQADYPLPAAFDQAYKDSQIVAFEVDIAQSESEAFRTAMMKAALLPAGTTLDKLLSPDTYQKLMDYYQDNQLPAAQLNVFKPSMIAMTLTLIELKKLGAGSDGVDRHFYQRARSDGKITHYLETLEQQIDFISSLGDGQEDEVILQTMKDIETLQSQFDEMIISWRNGDRAKLDKLFVKPMRDQFDSVYQQLLVQRNQNWMPQLKRYFQTPEIELVLVGSAHLIGRDGLLQQLEKDGYRITQLD